MAVTPKPAASVILVRETEQAGEALLVRKHADLAFAGGAFVFPGGKVEDTDVLPDDLYRPLPLGRADHLARRAYIGALCRETFEEIGVLLARHEDGSHCDEAVVEALNHHREEIDREPALFEALLRENGLKVHEEDFVYWANWITPSIVPKRFDTHFYVAAMPRGQQVKCDTAESTELLWLDLGTFNEREGEAIVPAPPTLFSLADLAIQYRRHQSLTSLLREELDRHIPRMMPKMLKRDDAMTVLMPWHGDYEAAPGEGVDRSGIPALYETFPTQVVPTLKVPGIGKG